MEGAAAVLKTIIGSGRDQLFPTRTRILPLLTYNIRSISRALDYAGNSVAGVGAQKVSEQQE